MTAKFWTKNGSDIWRLTERRVFEFKNLETSEVETCDCASSVIMAKFLPVEMPKKTTRRKRSPKPAKPAEKKTASAGKTKSKYKGVRPSGSKFTAQYWDTKTKQLKHLGTFDGELQAAAAVQEAIGNKKEARRLRNEYEEGDCRPEASESQVVHKKIFPDKNPDE